MGKKKTQKTKEIAVAIAETSISKLADDGVSQSPHPRKRGRPRKILDEPPQNQHNDEKFPPPVEVSERPPEKKAKATGDEPPPDSVEGGSKQQEQDKPKSGDGLRSRGRRKNKPRKSS